jgi:hypothetical protein
LFGILVQEIEMTKEQQETLNQIRRARNAYRSAIQAAEGFSSGKRVESLRSVERELKDLLWEHRDLIADLGEPI